MKELARFSCLEIISFPFPDLMAMCIGKDIINNPNAIREDDLITGDVVFYEVEGYERVAKKDSR
jgi:hypothetical protein